MSRSFKRRWGSEPVTPGYERLHGLWAKWGLRSFCLVIAGQICVVVILVAPSLQSPALLLGVPLLLLGVICFAMMTIRAVQWYWVRHLYYRTVSRAERSQAYEKELRSRGAPGWYMRLSRRGRNLYLVGVFGVCIAVGSIALAREGALAVSIFAAIIAGVGFIGWLAGRPR